MKETHGLSVIRSGRAVTLFRSTYDQGPTYWQVREAPTIEALTPYVEPHPRG